MYYENVVESVTLIPVSGGRFEVTVDGELIFSKLAAGRHAQAGEVVALLKSRAEIVEQEARLGF